MSIPVLRPYFGDDEVEAIREVLNSGWVGPGTKDEVFEKAFADYVGTRVAVSLNSCSSALFLSMKVLDIAGREVITTPMTFVSTNHAILQNDGTPVFCDIDAETLNISPESIEANVTDKTAASVVMQHSGHACDMDPILEIANARDIPVIEDAAHAAGGRYKGRMAGCLGTVGCFSFHALKNMTTGDGGMLPAEPSQRLRALFGHIVEYA